MGVCMSFPPEAALDAIGGSQVVMVGLHKKDLVKVLECSTKEEVNFRRDGSAFRRAEVNISNDLHVTAFECGGDNNLSQTSWRTVLEDSSAIVFVVDASSPDELCCSDENNLGDSNEETDCDCDLCVRCNLRNLMRNVKLAHTPLLVLTIRPACPTSVSTQELAKVLGIPDLSCGRECEVMTTDDLPGWERWVALHAPPPPPPPPLAPQPPSSSASADLRMSEGSAMSMMSVSIAASEDPDVCSSRGASGRLGSPVASPRTLSRPESLPLLLRATPVPLDAPDAVFATTSGLSVRAPPKRTPF
ncbi:hypothetical protein PAPYR_6826 [Paratrimastix pyriformis]|uniref:Uncharacterized protein n=1 Tax=Paratrimastix pyriformis TaxID=342808 RepID=A0ABQ8UHL9_9EUKA|nr:hypothetical protein PAPYR_6826 [Paratrimastix pyriformis]